MDELGSSESVEEAAGSGIDFAVAVAAVLLFAFGIVIGERVGEELAGRCVSKRDYWLANLGVLLAGSLASALVWATGWVLLAAVVIGMIAGGVAGLKLGFGESVGPWKFHDEKLHVNKDQLETARSGKGEARRRRRREGGPEPELMSVEDDPTVRDGNHSKGSASK